MNDVVLEARGLCKAYGRTEALRGVSLEVRAGEVLAITGASGSGKSTLLLTLAGVLRPEAGEVRFLGHRLDDLGEAERTRLRRRDLGIVLQLGHLVPELTAAENVAIALMLEGHGRAESLRVARGRLERVGAADLAQARPAELSGGELQRVAVARALVTSPRAVLADEPTGALDTVAAEEVMRALMAEVKESGASLVLVTHDHRVAARADREVVLRDGLVEHRP